MFNIKKVIIFSTFILNLSCNSTDCRVDSSFVKLYNSSLSYITSYYEEGKDINEEKLFRAFVFMGKITEHPSSRVAGHFGIIYHSKKDYQKDIKIWKEWFNVNKCSFSYKDASKIFNRFSKDVKDGAQNWEEFLNPVAQ